MILFCIGGLKYSNYIDLTVRYLKEKNIIQTASMEFAVKKDWILRSAYYPQFGPWYFDKACSWLQEESISLWRHIYLSVTFLTLSSWIGHAEVIFTKKVTNNFRSRICNITPHRFHDFFQTFQRMMIKWVSDKYLVK